MSYPARDTDHTCCHLGWHTFCHDLFDDLILRQGTGSQWMPTDAGISSSYISQANFLGRSHQLVQKKAQARHYESCCAGAVLSCDQVLALTLGNEQLIADLKRLMIYGRALVYK